MQRLLRRCECVLNELLSHVNTACAVWLLHHVKWSRGHQPCGAEPDKRRRSRALSRCRTTTGSETTMKAFGPNASLYTPPLSMNLSAAD